MAASSGPRSTRDRPAKPPLSATVIIDTALAILRAEGLDAVTMRRIAAELDTGPASLYVYVRGSRELREAMLERVTETIRLEAPDRARWREQIVGLTRAVLKAFESHPGIARVAVATIPTGEGSARFVEAMLGMLRAGGIDDQGAAWACDVLALLTTATALETDTYRDRSAGAGEPPEPPVAAIREAMGRLPADRFPLVTALADELTAGDGDQRFTFAIETFLDGLVARAGRKNY